MVLPGLSFFVYPTRGIGVHRRQERGLEMCSWIRIHIYRSSESWFPGKEAKQTNKRETGDTRRPILTEGVILHTL